MKTAIDSSVLWGIFKGEPDAAAWMQTLIAARRRSSLVVCDVVFAEVATLFKTRQALEKQLDRLGVEFDAIQPSSAYMAGELFRKYRRQGGPRSHLIPDFLIAAHAANQADSLAALDRGYLRGYFPTLQVLTPGEELP